MKQHCYKVILSICVLGLFAIAINRDTPPKPIQVIRPHLKSPTNFESYNLIFQQDLEYLEEVGFKKGTPLPSGLIYK